MKRAIAGVTGSGGLLSALAAAGWKGVVVLIAVIVVVIGAACWVVNDSGRAQRLNLLIATCLGHSVSARRRKSGLRGESE